MDKYMPLGQWGHGSALKCSLLMIRPFCFGLIVIDKHAHMRNNIDLDIYLYHIYPILANTHKSAGQVLLTLRDIRLGHQQSSYKYNCCGILRLQYQRGQYVHTDSS